ncbi:MAG: hypothetical protein SGJ19_17975 [Planctomycetia bacterium]|nr:hypothetical protein [Planctomycetia bacterium]
MFIRRLGSLAAILMVAAVDAERREDWLPRVRKLLPDGTATVIAEIKQRGD